MNRRSFLEQGVHAGLAACAGYAALQAGNASADTAPHEALYYERIADNRVRCMLCPRECVISEGDRGFCSTRENRDGTLYSLVYGRVAAFNVDPIEKKPFFHVSPGALTFSLATAGCNMWCTFCQNHHLSQSTPEEVRSMDTTPEQVAREARSSGSKVIAYTYNEPTVFNEFAVDCARAGLEEGVRSVVVSNGYINKEPLERLSEVIAAYKVDFKAFSKSFYREVTGGERDHVLNTIKRLKKLGVWTELVHLTIPTLNDGDDDFSAMADWLMTEIGPDIPVHFTRFHPTYQLTDLPVTPVSTLERARDILMERGMHYVYVGNVPGHPGESTWCPECGARVIERGRGYSVGGIAMKDGACAACGTLIPGIWDL